MKPLVIYHASCADGAGAAFAAWCKFGEEAEYLAARYGDPRPLNEVVRGRDVYVLDFSYPMLQFDYMAEFAANVYVLDHHKSFFETFMGYAPPFRNNIRVKLDMNKSGAVLAWEHFHPGKPVPEVIRYIQDRDLWKWELPQSREVSAALWLEGAVQDFHVLAPFKDDKSSPDLMNGLVEDGATILRVNEQYVEAQARHAEVVELLKSPEGDWRDGLRCLAANVTVLHSEAGNVLAERSKAAGLDPMAAVWSYDGSRGLFRVSLRSVGDFDVSVIAKHFGGGGHRNAAGFDCDHLPWRSIGALDLYYKLQVGRAGT